MSRSLERLKESDQHLDLAPDEDQLEAEHDPAVSRRASLADLRRHAAVQRKGAGDASTDAVHEAAAQGVASPAGQLPHLEEIQKSFGAHDVSQIQAHVGGDSAQAMGAEAYATGNHVVFDKQPDLHTAAHEAAHVVQQSKGVSLYGGVGKAGDTHEQQADAVADRVVQGKSAEDLLGSPSSAGASGAVQKKPAPSQAYADQSVIHAIQAHVKLCAARMHAGAAKITEALGTDYGLAGDGPKRNIVDEQIAVVNGDLEVLYYEVMRVPQVLRGTLDQELGAIYGAFHESWARALNSAYSSLGMTGLVTSSRSKMQLLFGLVGKEEGDVKPVYAPRIASDNVAEQRDEELKAAEMEALQAGMYSVEVALDLINADLHSSVADQSKQASDLAVSVQQLVNVLEPINPDHIGKIKKLPILIKKVRALQAEVKKMKADGNDKGLARLLVDDVTMKVSLGRMDDKIATINWNRKHSKHHR